MAEAQGLGPLLWNCACHACGVRWQRHRDSERDDGRQKAEGYTLRCEQGGMLTATMRRVDSHMCTQAGLLQWRVLADNLPTSGTFEWKVPESCVQGPYMIQAKLKGAAAVRRQAPAGKAGNGSMIGGLGSLVGGGGAAAGILSPALRLYVR